MVLLWIYFKILLGFIPLPQPVVWWGTCTTAGPGEEEEEEIQPQEATEVRAAMLAWALPYGEACPAAPWCMKEQNGYKIEVWGAGVVLAILLPSPYPQTGLSPTSAQAPRPDGGMQGGQPWGWRAVLALMPLCSPRSPSYSPSPVKRKKKKSSKKRKRNRYFSFGSVVVMRRVLKDGF